MTSSIPYRRTTMLAIGLSSAAWLAASAAPSVVSPTPIPPGVAVAGVFPGGPAAGLRGMCLAAAQTETKPFAVEPARAADPVWFLRPELGSPPLYDGLG